MPEFRLSPPGAHGVSCNVDGAFIGAIPVLSRLQKNSGGEWCPRDCEELSEQISECYGLPIDMSSKVSGLKVIAAALNEGDVARAQIATVLLGIPDPLLLSKRARSRDETIALIHDLRWSGMLKWDAAEHPRWPAGTPSDKGGKFAPKGEGFWQMLGSRLSHETKSALEQIGRMQIVDSENDFAVANEGANAIAQDLKAYAEYRRQLWLDSHGHPFQVPVIEADDPLSERAALMGHFVLEPKAPLMRPATNADWIDPLINLASLGAMGAGGALRFAGPAAEVLGEIAEPAAESDILIGNSGFRNASEFTDAVTAKYQALYDEGYAATMKRVDQGFLPNDPLVIGNRTDLFARTGLRDWLTNVEGIEEGPGQIIRVNRRLYDPLGSGSYRVPDIHIPDSQTILDGSIQFKTGSTSQIDDYKAFSGGARITIIRPSRAPSDIVAGSYGIVH